MNKYISKQELIEIVKTALDARKTFTVAIDGGSCSGKTTLGEELAELFPDSSLFHMDDFYLRAEQRTPERYREPGGNVDRERFLEEVLIPMHDGRDVLYRPIRHEDFSVSEGCVIEPGRLRLIEGSYSHHPYLRNYYDIRVFLDIDTDKQRERLIVRNTPEEQERFIDKWIPLENRYMEAFDIKAESDYIIKV